MKMTLSTLFLVVASTGGAIWDSTFGTSRATRDVRKERKDREWKECVRINTVSDKSTRMLHLKRAELELERERKEGRESKTQNTPASQDVTRRAPDPWSPKLRPQLVTRWPGWPCPAL